MNPATPGKQHDIVIDGIPFRTGCNIPHPSLFAGIPTITSAYPVINIEDAKAFCAQKTWKAADAFGRDWIKNQGQFGSCNGYAGAGALERSRVRRKLEHIVLSGDGLYAEINGGRDDGSQLVDGMNAILNNGIPSAATVPYGHIYKNQIPASAWTEATRFKGFNLYQLKTEADLITALTLWFDVVVAVNVNNDWLKMNSQEVIPPQPGPGNHAIGVDDIRYNTSSGRFEFQHYGSWGPDNHNNGRAWLDWNDHLKTTVNYHGFYAIQSTMDDPQGKNPPVPQV